LRWHLRWRPFQVRWWVVGAAARLYGGGGSEGWISAGCCLSGCWGGGVLFVEHECWCQSRVDAGGLHATSRLPPAASKRRTPQLGRRSAVRRACLAALPAASQLPLSSSPKAEPKLEHYPL
jgi:hypothetical protein